MYMREELRIPSTADREQLHIHLHPPRRLHDRVLAGGSRSAGHSDPLVSCREGHRQVPRPSSVVPGLLGLGGVSSTTRPARNAAALKSDPHPADRRQSATDPTAGAPETDSCSVKDVLGHRRLRRNAPKLHLGAVRQAARPSARQRNRGALRILPGRTDGRTGRGSPGGAARGEQPNPVISGWGSPLSPPVGGAPTFRQLHPAAAQPQPLPTQSAADDRYGFAADQLLQPSRATRSAAGYLRPPAAGQPWQGAVVLQPGWARHVLHHQAARRSFTPRLGGLRLLLRDPLRYEPVSG
jgi:hypothetical protein